MSSLQWFAMLNAWLRSGERPSLIMQFAVSSSATCSVRLRGALELKEQFAVACNGKCSVRVGGAPKPNRAVCSSSQC